MDEKEEYDTTPEVDDEEFIEEESNIDTPEESEIESPEANDNPYGLKEGFGRKEYEKTLEDKDYYKKEAEELKARQEKARLERANRFKNPAAGEEGSEASSSAGASTDPNKKLSKEERDAQKKSATPTEGEKKNLKDKVRDAKESAAASKAVAQNKINAAKAKAYAARHPIEAGKATVKNKIKKKILTVVVTYWWVFLIIALVLFVLMLIFLVVLGASDSDSDSQNGYLDPKYDYTQVLVTLTNSYTNEADKVEFDRKITLEDLVMGSVYYETRNLTEGLNDKQLEELYKSYSVLLKTEALALGKYTNETMEISIKSGADLPYCDPYNGCVVKEKNGIRSYISTKFQDTIDGEVIATIEPMDPEKIAILEKAYSLTKYDILTPDSVNSAIENYSYSNPVYNGEIKDSILAKTQKNKEYDDTLESIYNGYKVYNIRDYATYYSYTNNTSYWWPIGSSQETAANIYGGDPSSTTITSKFTNSRTIQGITKAHKGIDIGGSFGTTVIIATRSGTVTTAVDGCDSMGYYGSTCNGGYGNYVMIDHGDGTSSVYAHMYKGSLSVKSGDKVNQGQKIGIMGSSGSSTGAHLHFEIRINGAQVDPLLHVDPKNPRPVQTTGEGTVVNGNSNVQTVCLSLKASGFSNEAVAGILANIEAESSFRTNAEGDHGTSFGLCQWHNGRATNMKNFCGSNWANDAGCQVKYLIYELQNSERSAYNALIAGGTAYDLGAAFCTKFERPSNTQACYSVRGTNARDKYYPYVQKNCSN